MIPAVLLMGPTASGKSALALALAERFDVEIVSVDSAQIYRGMDIGTAKPDAATRERVVHHLIDIVDPTESYSAARFRADALAAVGDIRGRGRVPLFVGGTMLYFKALTEGLSALPRADAGVRARIDARAAADGWPALHAALAPDRSRDRRSACIPPTRSESSARSKCSSSPASRCRRCRARARRGTALGAAIPVAIVPPDRARLHAAIAERFDAMLAAGLVDELRDLRARLRADAPTCRRCAASAIGRPGNSSTARSMRPRSARTGIAATRQLAKRQFTWLRATAATAFDPLRCVRRGRCAATHAVPRRRRAADLTRRSSRARLLVHNPPRRELTASSASNGHAGAHPLRQAVGQPRRPHRGGRHGAALHRPPPRARGHEPAGLRGTEARRPRSVARRLDRRHGRPQHAHAALGSRHRRSRCRGCRSRRSTPTSGHRREGVLPVPRQAPGHRPRDRSRAGRDAARDDGRLRRFAHEHARRVRGARVRHRHVRGRARAGNAVPPHQAGEDDVRQRRGHAACRVHGQGHRRSRSSAASASPAAAAMRSNTPAARFARCRWKAG